jgi:glycosyltransferase involved in cell wall biosynthesis
MRFGIEAGSWINPRGYGRFLRGLYGGLARRGRHAWILALDAATAEEAKLPTDIPRQVIATGYAASRGAAVHHRRSLGEMVRMSRGLARGRYNALLFPSPHTYVPVPGTRELLVIHDVTAERFPELVFESALAARRWRWKTSIAVRRARRILTVSEHSKLGIAEIYGVDPERILVAPEAPDPVFLTAATPVARPRPYVLFVGGFSPHKNIGVLLEALERVPGLDLVLAGPFKSDLFHAGDVMASVQMLGLSERVETLADLDDAALRDLYAGALALVLPSFDEGFGLPAVEAAAVGTAVILSKTTAAADLFGPDALSFDPEDAAELALQLELVRDDPAARRALAERGRQKARAMTWEKAAEVVERAAEEAAGA